MRSRCRRRVRLRSATRFEWRSTCSLLLLWAATSAGASGCSDGAIPRSTWADAGAASATRMGGGFVAEGFTYDSKEDCLSKNGGLLLILDRDGDGVTAWWSERCNDYTQLPTGYYRGNSDCNDTDPT